MLKLITLGTGNAFAHRNSFQSAHYIELNNRKILFDCGPAILNAIQNAKVNIDDLEYLFISHLHGDHLSGVPFLLLHYKYVLERKNFPLKIVGPIGLKKQLEHAFKGSYPGLLTNEENLFEIIEIEVNKPFTFYDSVVIRPFEAFHIPNAFCYSLEFGNLKLVYSGDNELKPIQIPQFKNTTVLLHELTSMTSTQGGHTSWAIMKEFLEEILNNVNYIVLVHTNQDVIDAPNEIFPSNVFRAKDGNIFEFNESGKLIQTII